MENMKKERILNKISEFDEIRMGCYCDYRILN